MSGSTEAPPVTCVGCDSLSPRIPRGGSPCERQLAWYWGNANNGLLIADQTDSVKVSCPVDSFLLVVGIQTELRRET